MSETPATEPKKTSTGAKLFFGCIAVGFLGIVALAVAVAVGGFALKRGVESAIGTVGDQAEATRMLQQLEEEHPFTPSPDGVVESDQVDRFLAVTQDAWREMEEWAEDVESLRDMTRNGRDGTTQDLREIASGTRALAGFVRMRLAIAEALDANDTSLGEFVWTGVQLSRAHEALEGGRSTEGIAPETLRLAEQRADDLPRFDSDEADPGLVLAAATMWGMTDMSGWSALGLDTLMRR